MRIAIASDSHENYHHLEWFLKECAERKIDTCVFLGDSINPGFTRQFAESMPHLYWVWGNNDGDKLAMARALFDNKHHVAKQSFDELELDGKRVFATHYPVLAKNAAKSRDYDAAFYGHDHVKHEERIGDTLFVNPGELSGQKTGIVTFYVWDTETNTGEFVQNTKPQLTRDI